MFKTRTLLSLALIPLLVFLLSCGGSDDDDADSSSGGGDTPSATEATGSGSSDSNSSASTNDDDDDDPDAEEILANCPELLSLFGSLSPAAFATGGGDAEGDLEDLQNYLATAADNAPDEIADDFQVLADAFGAFFSVLAEYEVDLSNPATFATLDAEAQVELQNALEAIGTADVETASDNISNYFTENCS